MKLRIIPYFSRLLESAAYSGGEFLLIFFLDSSSRTFLERRSYPLESSPCRVYEPTKPWVEFLFEILELGYFSLYFSSRDLLVFL